MASWQQSSRGYGDQVGYLLSPNDTIICPYNTSHVVGVSRMHRHLDTCRKKNPDKAALISICPYNVSHHIPTADMSAHLVICRDYLAHKFQNLIRRDNTPSALPLPVMETPDAFWEAPPKVPTPTPLPLPPAAPAPRVTKQCVVKKEMRDGELWTTFEGEGYPLGNKDYKDDGNRFVAPKVRLPPCDQEEIDNWKC